MGSGLGENDGKGQVALNKRDEYSEKFQSWGGGGHFQSKNLSCRFWNSLSRKFVEKKLQQDFPKMRGESQRLFGTFPKIHPC